MNLKNKIYFLRLALNFIDEFEKNKTKFLKLFPNFKFYLIFFYFHKIKDFIDFMRLWIVFKLNNILK